MRPGFNAPAGLHVSRALHINYGGLAEWFIATDLKSVGVLTHPRQFKSGTLRVIV